MFSPALPCSSCCSLLTWTDKGLCGPFCLAVKCSYNVLPVTQSRCFVDVVSQRTKWNVCALDFEGEQCSELTFLHYMFKSALNVCWLTMVSLCLRSSHSRYALHSCRSLWVYVRKNEHHGDVVLLKVVLYPSLAAFSNHLCLVGVHTSCTPTDHSDT